MDITLLPERFRKKFVVSTEHFHSGEPCWEWTGTILDTGYGQYYVGGGQKHRVQIMAHRLAHEILIGLIPPGLHIDHLCRNRRCVNPLHLEPVTPRENVLRGVGISAGNAQKTHCVYGHPFDSTNTYVPPGNPNARMCRICMNARSKNGYRKRYAYYYAHRRSAAGKATQQRYRDRNREKCREAYRRCMARKKANALTQP